MPDVIGVEELTHNPQILAPNEAFVNGLTDCTAHLGLVAIRCGTVKQAVATANRFLDGTVHVARRRLPQPEADARQAQRRRHRDMFSKVLPRKHRGMNA